MLRELTSHRVGGLNEALRIDVQDEPGQGGACHDYRVCWTNAKVSLGDRCPDVRCYISFQNGPVQEVGVNGVSDEAFLAIVEDRLIGFQSGKFACRENALALTKVQEAMMWLQKRTRDRAARGAEGTSEK